VWWDEAPKDKVRQDDGSTAPYRMGVRRLSIASLTCLAISLVTYLIPGMDDFRPWIPGETPPLARTLFLAGPSEDEPAVPVGPAGTPAAGPLNDDQTRAKASEVLGEHVAANLAPADGAGGRGDELADIPETHHGIRIEPDELEGLGQQIEDPSGHALDAFNAALYRTAGGSDRHLTRIAHWGDSTIASDDVTGTLRRRFQKRFGDGGHGFLLTGKGTMPYRHKDVVQVESGTWTLNSVIRNERRDGRYGYGGHLHRSRGEGRALFGTVDIGPIGRNVSRFEVFYQAHPEGGTFVYRIDDGPAKPIVTRSPGSRDDRLTIEVEDGPHRLHLKTIGDGEVRLYGAVLEREGPGVVYDSLGIVGARASRLLNFDQGHLIEQVGFRSPDLLIIAFGGNESGDRKMNFAHYEKTLIEVVRRMRSGRPEAACLLMAPLDQGEVGPRGKVRTMPTIPRIVAVQRAVAAAEGCAFFDTFQAMGGEGAMYRWYRARPRLGWGDYRHATPAGYEVIGNLFYKALIKDFSDWLERNGLARQESGASVSGRDSSAAVPSAGPRPGVRSPGE
jgi:lysophospholipase L1-like esterase